MRYGIRVKTADGTAFDVHNIRGMLESYADAYQASVRATQLTAGEAGWTWEIVEVYGKEDAQ